MPSKYYRIQCFWLCFLFLAYGGIQAQKTGLQKESIEQRGEELYKKAFGAFFKDLDTAIFYFNQAIPLFEETENWEGYINCYLALTNCYHKQGDYDRYLEYADTTLQESLAHFGEYSKAYRSSVNNLAYAYKEKGDYGKAISLLEKIVQQEMETGKLDFAALLETLGHFYREQGDVDEALYNYSRALHLIRESPDATAENLTSSFIKVSQCLMDKGQLDSARFLLKKALSLMPEHGKGEKGFNLQEKIQCLIQLAEISLLKQESIEAEKYALQAIRWSREVFNFGLGKSYKTMGRFHLQQNEFKKAIQSFNLAKEAIEEKYESFARHPSIGFCHKDLAEVYFGNNDLDEALKQYQQAFLHLTLNFQPSSFYDLPEVADLVRNVEMLDLLLGYAQALKHRYGTLSSDLKGLKAALESCNLASQLINLLRQQYQAQGSKFLLSERALPLYELAIEIAFELEETTQNPFYREEAFRFAEANKALVMLESIQESLAQGFGDLPDSLVQAERAMKLDLSFYEKTLAEESRKTGQDEVKLKRLNDKLFLLRRQYQELVRNIEKDYPKYHALKFQTETVDIDQIQTALLDDDSALLEFFIGEKNIYSFLLSSSDLDVFRFDIDQFHAEDLLHLNSLIKNEPLAASFEQDFQSFCTLASRLYEQLLKSPLEKTNKGIKKLLIIPDGALCFLPFELLLSDNDQTDPLGNLYGQLPFLFQDYSVGYAYSVALLLKSFSVKPGKPQRVFAGFAPSFKGPAGEGSRSCINGTLSDLACNGYEVETIGELLNGDLNIGLDARKESLLETAGRYKIIHLATHACVDNKNPMLNKIFFTGDYLTYFDIQNLRLNADLAVLSACETGSGKLLKGEGVMSLSRGFRLSGCKSSLMSLWAANDCSTANLMVNFYKNLKKGETKDNALRNAKLEYLQTADKLSAHPYYWAAFVFFGNNEPIDFPVSRIHWMLYLVGSLLVLFIGWLICRRNFSFKPDN